MIEPGTWRIVSIAVVLAILLTGCGSQPLRSGDNYTVKAGDTLYSIAWRNGIDYRELARMNSVGRDYRIYPGQVLHFNAAPTAGSTVKPTSAMPLAIRHTWLWPASSDHYAVSTRPNGGRGLLIDGNLGQDIRAAAAGRVVYSGNGLLGYGQLLIVKHDDTYLSAYGHTQSVLVHEGEQVTSGQKIATMGNGPNGKPLLYFEIRVNGQPVDPLPLLPQQR